MAGHPEETDLRQDVYTGHELEDSEPVTGSVSLDAAVSSFPHESLAGSNLDLHLEADEYGDGDLPNPSPHSRPEAQDEEEGDIPHTEEDKHQSKHEYKPEDLGHE